MYGASQMRWAYQAGNMGLEDYREPTAKTPESHPAYDVQKAAEDTSRQYAEKYYDTGGRMNINTVTAIYQEAFQAGARWQREHTQIEDAVAAIGPDAGGILFFKKSDSSPWMVGNPDAVTGVKNWVINGDMQRTRDGEGKIGRFDPIHERLDLFRDQLNAFAATLSVIEGNQDTLSLALDKQDGELEQIRKLGEAIHGVVSSDKPDAEPPISNNIPIWQNPNYRSAEPNVSSIHVEDCSDELLEQLYRSEQLPWGRYEEELERRAKLDGGLSVANSLIRHRDSVIRCLRAEVERLTAQIKRYRNEI